MGIKRLISGGHLGAHSSCSPRGTTGEGAAPRPGSPLQAPFLKRPPLQKAAVRRKRGCGGGARGSVVVTHATRDRSPFSSLSHSCSSYLRVWVWAHNPLLPASHRIQSKLGNVKQKGLGMNFASGKKLKKPSNVQRREKFRLALTINRLLGPKCHTLC